MSPLIECTISYVHVYYGVTVTIVLEGTLDGDVCALTLNQSMGTTARIRFQQRPTYQQNGPSRVGIIHLESKK